MIERWIWRNFGLSVPLDWEMLQFSRNPELGRCAFADRYQFRLELDWRVVPGPPDFDRMMSDYLASLRERGMTDGARFKHRAWYGVGGELDGQATTRLGRWFPAERSVVELVFLWPRNKDAALMRQIADSVTEEPEHGGRFRRWRAFGMDLLAAKDLPLRSCTVEPANVGMTFADQKSRSVERFGRRGMVREWLKQTPEQWLRRWVDEDLRGIRTSVLDVRGHSVNLLAGELTVPGLRRRRANYDAAAWICPADGRFYSVSCTGPAYAAEAGAMVAGGRLSCCPALELPT